MHKYILKQRQPGLASEPTKVWKNGSRWPMISWLVPRLPCKISRFLRNILVPHNRTTRKGDNDRIVVASAWWNCRWCHNHFIITSLNTATIWPWHHSMYSLLSLLCQRDAFPWCFSSRSPKLHSSDSPNSPHSNQGRPTLLVKPFLCKHT